VIAGVSTIWPRGLRPTDRTLTDHIDPLGSPPSVSDVAAWVAWQIAKRQTQRNATQRQTPSLDLAAGR
jgi:hypothetical protein